MDDDEGVVHGGMIVPDSDGHVSRYAMKDSHPSRAHSTVPPMTPMKTPHNKHQAGHEIHGDFTLGERKGSIGTSTQAWTKSIRTTSVTWQNGDAGGGDGLSQAASRRQTATSQAQRQMTILRRPENGSLAAVPGGPGATAGLVRLE